MVLHLQTGYSLNGRHFVAKRINHVLPVGGIDLIDMSKIAPNADFQ